jgi:enolase
MLYIIRHGQSVWNFENKFTGWTDVELNENGIKEAENVGKIVKNLNINYVFTSNLKRTIQTAEIIKKNIINPDLTTIQDEALNERHYGIFTGKNKDEIKNEHGVDFVHTLRRSYTNKPENGESLFDVKLRTGHYFDKEVKPIIDKNNNVLIVAHGNSLRALFVHLGLKNENTIETFEIPTGLLIKIDLEKNDFMYLNNYHFHGRQILDSRGNPTIEVLCKNMENKLLGRGSSPSGASCGSKEAYEMRDGNKDLFNGKSVLSTLEQIKYINTKLLLKEENINDLTNIDNQLIKLDNSLNKTTLGGNTTTALSFCILDVISNLCNIEKYEYIKKIAKNTTDLFIPTPMANVLNGGKHGSGGLQIQEFMIFPNEKYDINRKIQIIYDTTLQLKKNLSKKYGHASTNLGDEGGFVPCGITTNFQALELLEESIKNANLIPNEDVFIALDCASSEFYDKKTKLYEIEENMHLTGIQLIEYYNNMLEKFPFIKSIEDPFDEDDYEHWSKFSSINQDKINIVGDDLYCSNLEYVNQGLKNNWANSLLLKVNQIGTISESILSANKMLHNNKVVIVSHRSGETNHSFIIDIAVGLGAQYVKIGGLCRGERIEKYNRLLEINDLL